MGAICALLLLCAVASALPREAAAEQASAPSSPAAGQLDAGANHTCVGLAGGSVRCWGFSGNGQLGYGNRDTIGDDETPASAGPVNLGGGLTAKAISAGSFHTCALLTDGSVRCWGFGADGRLGYGNTSSVESPGAAGAVDLAAGRTAVAISAGGAHTCALLTDGSVRCWGFASSGQLGYGNIDNVGDNETPRSAGPVKLGAGRTAVAISAGDRHTCAVLDNGSVRCWGEAADGELGYGDKNRVGEDETPDIGHPLSAVACPSASQCTAVDDIGQQVTFNPVAPGTPIPTTIDSGGRLSGVACPSASQCTAVDGSGRQVTFNPVSPGAPIPTMIDSGGLSGVACPSASQCTAVDGSGRQVTFNPAAPGTPTPTTIDSGRSLFGVACPSASQCTAVDDIGRQVTFNPAAPGTPTPTTIDSGRRLLGVACPSTSQCTAVSDDIGQQVTFNPTAPGTPTPTTISSGGGLRGVACSSESQCTAFGGSGRQVTFNPTAPGTPTSTIIDSGRVLNGVACPSTSQCTAVDDRGRQVTFNPAAPGTPTPTTIDPIPPVNLGSGRTAVAISAGERHTCAVLDNGSVRCWGDGGNGELGYGNTNSIGDNEAPATAGPVSLGRPTATAISAGADHTCAVLDNGSVRCWGLGTRGRLAYGNLSNIGDNEAPDTVGPVNLGAGRTAAAISAGGDHTCARLDNGSVRCWGYGANGRLGYCNDRTIGDDELPDAAGPVNLEPGDGGAACASGSPPGGSPSGDSPVTPPTTGVPPVTTQATGPPQAGRGDDGLRAALALQARRARALRTCLAAAKRKSGGKRGSARKTCLKRYGRTPGRVKVLKARAASKTKIVLTFTAPGTDGSRPPAARSYLVRQSLTPIRTARDFARAQTLCEGSCRFATNQVGAKLTLTVGDLRRRTTYYYAIAARDNVSGRLGPRTQTVKARTR